MQPRTDEQPVRMRSTNSVTVAYTSPDHFIYRKFYAARLQLPRVFVQRIAHRLLTGTLFDHDRGVRGLHACGVLVRHVVHASAWGCSFHVRACSSPWLLPFQETADIGGAGQNTRADARLHCVGGGGGGTGWALGCPSRLWAMATAWLQATLLKRVLSSVRCRGQLPSHDRQRQHVQRLWSQAGGLQVERVQALREGRRWSM